MTPLAGVRVLEVAMYGFVPSAGAAPGFAQQTDQILEELDLDWDKIIDLKAAGAVT